jgi:NDP-sugar pyrophosphorylase family protein
MQCVILAGGLATRMLPLTLEIPKSLLDVNDFPFIYYQLKWLKKQNITDVVISIGHLGDCIQNYVKNGEQFGLNVTYVKESVPLGTAGALKLAYDLSMLDDKFYVMYGDSFLPINFEEVNNSFNNKTLMTFFKNNNLLDKSNIIRYTDHILYDPKYKLNNQNEYKYIDFGLSIIKKDIISNIPSNTKYNLSDFFHDLSINNSLQGFEVYTRFFEIGSFQGLNDFRSFVNEQTISYFG